MKAVLDSIDRDIETHTSRANQFLNTVHGMLFVAMLFAALYVLPGLAARALPEFESELIKDEEQHSIAVKQFQEKYKKDFYYVSKDEYKEANQNNQASPEMIEARTISQKAPTYSFVKTLRFVKALSVEDSKMESLAKIIPIIF